MKFTITVPWPDKILSPNARPHWAVKAKAVKLARRDGYFCALMPHVRSHIAVIKGWENITCEVQFFPPDARSRDRDGLMARLKATFDGIADAWGVNDKKFIPVPNPIWGDQIYGGEVRITFREWKAQ